PLSQDIGTSMIREEAMDEDIDVRARLQRAVIETRRGRRRLGARIDELRTIRTLPRRTRPLRHTVAGPATVPTVARDVWRLHVSYFRMRDERDRGALV